MVMGPYSVPMRCEPDHWMAKMSTSTAADSVHVRPKLVGSPGCPLSSDTVPALPLKRHSASPMPSTADVTDTTGVSTPSDTCAVAGPQTRGASLRARLPTAEGVMLRRGRAR